MSEGFGWQKQWSLGLPRLLFRSWFMLVLGPPLFYLILIINMWFDPLGRGPFCETAFDLYFYDFLFSLCLAPVWLVLFVIAAVARRGNLGRWLWLQAISMACLASFFFYWLKTHPFDM